MILLLDACAIIRLAAAPEKLSQKLQEKLKESSTRFILPLTTLLEIEHQYQRGRFPVPAVKIGDLLPLGPCEVVPPEIEDLAYYPQGLEIFDATLVAMARRQQDLHPDEEVAIATCDSAIASVFKVIW